MYKYDVMSGELIEVMHHGVKIKTVSLSNSSRNEERVWMTSVMINGKRYPVYFDFNSDSWTTTYVRGE